MLLETIGSVWSGHGSSGPRALFLNSEPGFYLDFSATKQLYQDNIGATPLTTPEQQVGLAADRSRTRSPITVAAAVRASLGLRPKWGRAPKVRRNLLTYSDPNASLPTGWAAFNAAGTNSRTLVSAFGAIAAQYPSHKAIRFETTTGRAGIGQVISVTAGVPYALTCYVAPGGVSTGAGGEIVLWAYGVGTGVSATKTISDADANGRLTISFTPASSGTVDVIYGAGVGASVTADVTMTAPQLERDAATAYQKVTTSFDMDEAGLPSYGFIRPDLSDDVLTVTTPAAQTGDVLVFGRNGSWIESGVTYGSGAAVTIGVATVTGLPDRLLAAIGDIVGIVAIGRALTAAERTQALEYHKARGAAGWLVAGAEAEPNGAFASGTGWTPLAGWAISGGAANATATSASLTSTTTLTAGRLYLVTFDWTHTSGTLSVRVGAGAAATFTSSGAKRMILQTTSVAGVEFYGGGVTGVLDNVSVKLLTVAA